MIDITKELPIPLSAVPKLQWLQHLRQRLDPDIGAGGRRLHVSTVYRWTGRGLRGQRLEYVQLGGTRVTTVAALLRFFESLTPQSQATAVPPTTRNRKDQDNVERQLDAAGL